MTAPNTVIEADFWHSGDERFSWHSSRIPLDNYDHRDPAARDSALERLANSAATAVELLRPCDPQLVVLGLSAEPFRDGVAGHTRLKQRLSDVAGVPVFTVADALLAEIAAASAQRIAILTPFSDTGNRTIRNFFGELDLDPVAMVGLACVNAAAIARVPKPVIRDALRKLARPDVELIIQVGTNLDFIQAADEASRWLDTRVIACNQALLSLVRSAVYPRESPDPQISG